MLFFNLLFLLFNLCVSAAPQVRRAAFKLPFHTEGPEIKSADGDKVQLVGTNWPGHQEAMIPEGLQYSSIKDIVTKITGFKLNVVRLTFAIEMVDDILDNGGDVSLEDTLTTGLGATNGSIILDKILKQNPQFTASTTRLEIFDAVAAELAAQGVYVHLDNHMSHAKWCCGLGDLNAWFGDTDFNVSKWIRGWKYMAAHAAENWSSFSSVGLRNELRQPDGPRGEPYDWYTWYIHMTDAAAAVHTAAPNALIFFSGLNYDVTISPIPKGLILNGTAGTATAGKTAHFDPESFPYKDKIVLELHKYDFEMTQASCSDFGASLYNAGYLSLNATDPKTKYTFPMLLSEFGFIQNGVYYNSTTYSKCLVEFFETWKPSGWMQWELGGSYYVRTRNGASPQDDDESWGLLNHDWSATRSQATVDNSLLKMVEATLG